MTREQKKGCGVLFGKEKYGKFKLIVCVWEYKNVKVRFVAKNK